MKRPIHALFLVGLTLLFLSSVMFPAAAQTTVHALLVIMDEDKSIGAACKVDQYYIENLLTSVGSCDRLYGEEKNFIRHRRTATFSQIEKWLGEVSPTPEDIVFVYYSGHGGMNNWEEKRTYFAMLEGIRLYRDDLVNLMKISTGSARLQMLITDCCSNTTEPPPIQIEEAGGHFRAKSV